MFFARSALGIDLTNHNVRIAWLRKNKRGIQVCNLVEKNIKDSSVEQILVKTKYELKKFCALPILLPKNQVICVSQSQVAIKRFPLTTYLPELEQYMQVGILLSESLGLPYEQLLYDYQLAKQNVIEAYACRRALVQEKLSALVKVGYQPSILELQTQALMRLYQNKFKDLNKETAVLADIGFEHIQLLVWNGKAEPFYREITLCTDAAYEKDGVTQQLIEEILKLIPQINTQFSYESVNSLWLCGEAASSVDCEKITTDLHWQVSLFNPFEHLVVNLQQNQVTAVEKWTTAIGLALRGVESA